MSDEQTAPQGNEPQAGEELNRPTEAQAATATESAGEYSAAPGPENAASEPEKPAEAAEEKPQAEAPAEQWPATGSASPNESSPVASEAAPEEPKAAPPQPPGKPADLDPSAEFETALEAFEGTTTGTVYDEAFRRLGRGELVTARVIQVDNDKVFVDLGTKSEGVVPMDELSASPFDKAGDVVKVGDQINVVVIHPEGREGNPIVSRKRAEFEAAWDRLEEEFKNKETISAVATEKVKGGLVVDIGVRGFVPFSHVGSGHEKNIDKYVGQSLKLKIIELDRDRRKVILSNKAAEKANREERKKTIFGSVKPGDILEGTVRRVVDYGAFIDLGGADGLLHVSEMSWSRVEHPSEVLKEGDDIRVMVLRLDPDAGRISLGRRQVLPDPWSSIRDNYSVGQRLTLPVSRVVPSGAFVKLPEGAEAFIPVAEMAHGRINKPSDVVSKGQDVEVQVIDIRPDERRMLLSMRALLPYEERQQHHHHQPREDRHHRSDRSRDRRDRERDRGHGHSGHVSAPPANVTIGERLSALKGLAGYNLEEAVEEKQEEPEKPKRKEKQPKQETPAEEPKEAVAQDAGDSQGPAEAAAPVEEPPSAEVSEEPPPPPDEASSGTPEE